MAELLRPMLSNLGGHVVLGLAGLATLLALVGCSREMRGVVPD